MTSTLLIVQIVLALAITIAVLLQKSSSIGLGAYSGSNESVFGAKGPTGFLAKLTFSLAFAFIVNTLVLGYLYTTANTSSVSDSIVPANNAAVPTVPKTIEDVTPQSPIAPQSTATSEENSTTETNASVPAKETIIPTIEENSTASAN